MKLYTKIINEETKEVLIMNQEIAKQQNLEEMEVEFGYNGKCYLFGYAPQKPIEELKQEKLNFLNNETQKFIYTKYPIYKQLNIINPLNDYTDKDRNTMNEFINSTRNKNHKFAEQINNCATKEELDLININFE